MNILTFDIEDWYNCDFISEDFDWDRHEVRIYQGVDRILSKSKGIILVVIRISMSYLFASMKKTSKGILLWLNR